MMCLSLAEACPLGAAQTTLFGKPELVSLLASQQVSPSVESRQTTPT